MTKRILIIDAEAGSTGSLKSALESTGGYHVAVETEVRTALEMARTWEPRIVILDLDITLGGADGTELAAALHGDPRTQGVPIVCVTGLVSRQEVDDGLCTCGGSIVMPKPVDTTRLLRCLEEISARPGWTAGMHAAPVAIGELPPRRIGEAGVGAR